VRVFNVFDGELPETDEPNGRRWLEARIGPQLGGERIGASVYELPPRGKFFPYHYHYSDEEWVLVLSGTPTLRTPAGESVLSEGDVVCFRTGPEGAHTLWNDADAPARILFMSSGTRPEVIVYVDSNKIGTRPGRGEQDNFNFRRDTGLEYWDGEE